MIEWLRRWFAAFCRPASPIASPVETAPVAQPLSEASPAIEGSGLFPRTRFNGQLSGHGSSIPIGFDAWVDAAGRLHLELDRIPFSHEAYALHVSPRPGSTVDLIQLTGTSGADHEFRSDSFTIEHFDHGSQSGAELSYQGACYDAELNLPRREDSGGQRGDMQVWRVRQLRTFRRIALETPLGRVTIGGPRQDRETQEPNGFIAIDRPTSDTNESWWDEAHRFLTHVARVLSFACDTYLRPVIKERYSEDRVTVRLARLGPASGPSMAPFHELNMETIFGCACDSYFTRHDHIEQLDAAIRWLTAPIAYDESRLINAMSALENILDRCGLEEIELFMSGSAFKKVAKRLRELLAELKVPIGMAGKVPELNRRTLNEKVGMLLAARAIVVSDMPDDWLNTIIRQRNTIVHTGVSQDFDETEPDTLDHTIWAREIVTRIILERLGFVGAYQSWLHNDEQLHFPECIPMPQWVTMQEAKGELPGPTA